MFSFCNSKYGSRVSPDLLVRGQAWGYFALQSFVNQARAAVFANMTYGKKRLSHVLNLFLLVGQPEVVLVNRFCEEIVDDSNY